MLGDISSDVDLARVLFSFGDGIGSRWFGAGEGVIFSLICSPHESFLGVDVLGSSNADGVFRGDEPRGFSSSEDFSGVK